MTRTEILKCPNLDACLGGFKPESTPPIQCAPGYQGVLCHDCVKTEINGE